MSEENSGENNIETLAVRAKEMLDRVRSAADTDALAPPNLPLSTLRDKQVESEVDDEDTAVDEMADEDTAVDEIAVDEMADEDTADDEIAAVDEEDIIDSEEDSGDDEEARLDDATDLEDDTALEDTALDDSDLADVDLDDLDELDPFESADDAIIDHESTTDTVSIRADDESTDEDSGSTKKGGLLNLFGRKDERDTSEADDDADGEVEFEPGEVIELDAFDPEDLVLDSVSINEDSPVDEPVDEVVDIDAEPIDADTVIAELDDLDEFTFDPDSDELLDLDDSSEVEGVGYLGDVDLAEGSGISTDDLLPDDDDIVDEQVEKVAGLDFDISHDESETGDLVRGSAVVAGAAALATEDAPDLNAAKEDIRNRGRLSDLGSKSTPTPSKGGRFSSRRRPAVDHDLNDLFLKPTAPDQAVNERSYPWLIPLGFIAFMVMAISLLFFQWWAADDESPDDGAVQTTDTVDTSAPTSIAATTPTIAEAANTASSQTPSTEAPGTTAPLVFDSAFELIGPATNTADFAALGSPIGLQQLLEAKVDPDGNPSNFTVLAPSDAAIAKLSEADIAALADPNVARELINYHYIDRPLTPEFLAESVGGQIMTRSGVPIFVELVDGAYVFNGQARVELAGLEAENGSVIVIDSVLSPPTINELLDLGNIQFEVISSVITASGKEELQKAVVFFKENPNANALIAGHTDTDGDPDGNRRLSQRRADAVRQFLIDAGIDGDRLQAEGFGEDEPVLVNGVEDKNLSRRIEFILK